MLKSNQSTQKPEHNIEIQQQAVRKGLQFISAPLSEKNITQNLSTKQPSIYDFGWEREKFSPFFCHENCSLYCAF